MPKLTSSLATLVLVVLTLADAIKEDGLQRFELRSWSNSQLAADQSGAKAILPMTTHGLYEFYFSVKIGTPPQELRVSLGAKESDIWFLSSECKTDQCKGHRKYDHELSSTYKPNGAEVVGNDANYTGYLSTDTIRLGDLTLKDFTFGEATASGSGYRSFDGYLGIGPHRHALWSDSDHIVYKMIKQGIIKEPKVSLYYKKFGLNEGDSSGGEVIFGGVDESHFRGNISYVKNIYNKYITSWIFIISGVEAQEVEVCPNGCRMIIMYFNLLTYGPERKIKQLNTALGAKTLDDSTIYYFEDCSPANKPNITFTIGGQKLVMRPEHYLLEMPYKNKKKVCFSSFQEGGTDGWPWAIGTKFLTAFHTVFDFGGQQVGFAESV